MPQLGLELGFLTSMLCYLFPQGAPSLGADPAEIRRRYLLTGTSSPLTLLLTCGGVWLPVLASLPQSWERGLLSLPGCKPGAPRLAVGKASLCCVLEHWTENPESPASIQIKSGGSSSSQGLGWGVVGECSPSFPVSTSIWSPSPLREQLLCASHCFLYAFSLNP